LNADRAPQLKASVGLLNLRGLVKMTRNIICLIIALLLSQLGAKDSNAQSEKLKFEVGAQFSALRFGDLDVTEPGLGGRFAYNLNDNLALEAEGNFFPNKQGQDEQYGFLQGGRKTQALFGAKVGMRRERIGFFGKVRPGFVRFSNFERNLLVCLPGVPCPPQPPARFSETDFALDVGGVVELYPSRRSLLRIDVGDTIIHSTSGEEILIPGVVQSREGTFRSVVRITRSTSHNLQINVGVGFRF